MFSKKQFLTEHNRLSPVYLQATLALLNRFKGEKRPLLKNNNWSVDKLRIPFISWLISLPVVEKRAGKKQRNKKIFKDYPQTKF